MSTFNPCDQVNRKAKAFIFMAFLSSLTVASAHGSVELKIPVAEDLNQKKSRIPFPLLPPGYLPPAMPIPNIALEPDSDLLKGRIVLDDFTIFGLHGLSLIADLSIDYNNTLIVNLSDTTLRISSLRLNTIQEMNFTFDGMGMIFGHFLGHGEMNITIVNLLVKLDIQLRLTSTGQSAAEVLSLGLDVDERFEADNFTIAFSDVLFEPNDLLELIKALLPIVYPELGPTVLALLTDLLGVLPEMS